MISCCTMCVHFPDGLSLLLPDLVCVVLHSPVISVSSRTTLCHCIHLYISQRSVLSLSHLVCLAWIYRLQGLCATLTCAYFGHLNFFCTVFRSLSIYHLPILPHIKPLCSSRHCNYIPSVRPPPLQQVLRLL